MFFFFPFPHVLSASRVGSKGRARMSQNTVAEGLGSGAVGELGGGGRAGGCFHSVTVAVAFEAATVIFHVFRGVSYL